MKRSSCILVFNSKGEIALQLRAADDDAYPGCWDFAAGGGISAREEADRAAARELQEEIGINSPLEFLKQIDYTGPDKSLDGPIVDVELYLYKTQHDGPFVLDPKEVAEVRFFSLAEIEAMMEADKKKFHPEVLYVFKRYRDLILG